MLLDFTTLVKKYNLKIYGVIQCGAHWGQEYDDYIKNGIEKIIFIEPCKAAFEVLEERYGAKDNVQLWNTACGEKASTGTMYTGDKTINKGMSNSLLKPALHLQLHQDVKFTDEEIVIILPLDDLMLNFQGVHNLLVMDCQGYEGNVLRGAKKTLQQIDYVYSEINFANVYEGCTQADELDELLNEFTRVETGTKVGGMWSDCLYIRKTLL